MATLGQFSVCRNGVTRTVLLVGRYAVKVPSFRYGALKWRWRSFLKGLLANMQEKEFSDAGWEELCPVVFALPGGFLNVMRRAVPLTDEEFEAFDYRKFVTRGDPYGEVNLDRYSNPRLADEPACMIVPVEKKSDSFGWLDGRVVAVDYGN